MSRWMSIALIALVWIPSFRPQEKPPAAVVSSRAERLAAIQKEWDDARKAFSKAYSEAKSPAEREKLVYPDAKSLMPRVWDLVHEDSRDATALDALTWIVQMNPSQNELADALTAIEMDHLKSPKLGEICSLLGGNMQIDTKLLERIAAENPDHAVQGQALYAIATHRLESMSTALDVAKAEKEAAALLERVVKDFADVKGGRSTLGDAAGADLHELRDLALGKPAPDIEAEDITGVKFKLSDYRGKVVLLDFWGNW